MLYPTAGCRLFIADLPDTAPGSVPPEEWIEIGETEALGMLGVDWELNRVDIYDDCDQPGTEVVEKAYVRRLPIQAILGNDPTDPGQAVLWTAVRSASPFPFRLVFPDGVTARRWGALVTGFIEVFDIANSVMKLQADLQPTTPIEREN